MSDEAEWRNTQIEYVPGQKNILTFFSAWSADLWNRIWGRPATGWEDTMEQERYKHKPRS